VVACSGLSETAGRYDSPTKSPPQKTMDADVTALARTLKAQFPRQPKVPGLGWKNPALSVLDCVLSLNRRYDGFVLPRVREFQEAHPQIASLDSLTQLMRTHGSPAAFMLAELRYNHEERAETLAGVLAYLQRVEHEFTGPSQRHRLRRWAIRALPDDYRSVGVRGFGLSGFQYLRMQLGADTTKPDIHIRRYVADAIGRPVADIEALRLLEQAARRTGLRLRHLDAAIWNDRARGRAQ